MNILNTILTILGAGALTYFFIYLGRAIYLLIDTDVDEDKDEKTKPGFNRDPSHCKYNFHTFEIGDEGYVGFPALDTQTDEYRKKYQNINSSIRGYQKRTGTKFRLIRVKNSKGQYIGIKYWRIS